MQADYLSHESTQDTKARAGQAVSFSSAVPALGLSACVLLPDFRLLASSRYLQCLAFRSCRPSTVAIDTTRVRHNESAVRSERLRISIAQLRPIMYVLSPLAR